MLLYRDVLVILPMSKFSTIRGPDFSYASLTSNVYNVYNDHITSYNVGEIFRYTVKKSFHNIQDR